MTSNVATISLNNYRQKKNHSIKKDKVKNCTRRYLYQSMESDFLKKEKNKKIRKSNLETQYLDCYKYVNNKIILPDLSNLLINNKIDTPFRAKMIDWKIEVFFVFHNESINFDILFKSIQIMDLYFKYEKNFLLDNEDVHLIGITCMYISNKLEKRDDCSLLNFSKLSKGAYSNEDIIKKEFEILKALNFKVNYFTYLDLIDHFLFKLFDFENSLDFELLRKISRVFLIFLSFDQEIFYNSDSHIFITACLLNALRYFFSSLIYELSFSQDKKKIEEKVKIEKNIIKCILKQFSEKKIELKNESRKIQNYLKDFEENFFYLTQYKSLIDFNKSFIN